MVLVMGFRCLSSDLQHHHGFMPGDGKKPLFSAASSSTLTFNGNFPLDPNLPLSSRFWPLYEYSFPPPCLLASTHLSGKFRFKTFYLILFSGWGFRFQFFFFHLSTCSTSGKSPFIQAGAWSIHFSNQEGKLLSTSVFGPFGEQTSSITWSQSYLKCLWGCSCFRCTWGDILIR